eukprot:895310-Pelagomonas_calceolata.AAC.2
MQEKKEGMRASVSKAKDAPFPMSVWAGASMARAALFQCQWAISVWVRPWATGDQPWLGEGWIKGSKRMARRLDKPSSAKSHPGAKRKETRETI